MPTPPSITQSRPSITQSRTRSGCGYGRSEQSQGSVTRSGRIYSSPSPSPTGSGSGGTSAGSGSGGTVGIPGNQVQQIQERYQHNIAMAGGNMDHVPPLGGGENPFVRVNRDNGVQVNRENPPEEVKEEEEVRNRDNGVQVNRENPPENAGGAGGGGEVGDLEAFNVNRAVIIPENQPAQAGWTLGGIARVVTAGVVLGAASVVGTLGVENTMALVKSAVSYFFPEATQEEESLPDPKDFAKGL